MWVMSVKYSLHGYYDLLSRHSDTVSSKNPHCKAVYNPITPAVPHTPANTAHGHMASG